MAALTSLELISVGRQGPEPQGMWQCWSLPQPEAGFGVTVHVAMPEPASTGRQGLEPQGTWQCTDACPPPCLGLKLVRGGTRSAGYRH
jgi:hypothetical protein